MNNAFRSSLVAVALLVAGCDASGSESEPVGAQAGEVDLALGQTASLSGLSVTFEAVVEDTRCPDGVDCFWDGQALVSLRVASRDADLLVVDRPEAAPEAGVTVDGRTFFAVRLTPKPTADGTSSGTPVVTVATVIGR